MTELIFDLNSSDLRHCPKCGKEFQGQLRWIDVKSKIFACSSCGSKINGDKLSDALLSALGESLKKRLRDKFPKGKGNSIEFEEHP